MEEVVGSRTHMFVDSLCEKVLRNKGVLSDGVTLLKFTTEFIGGEPLSDRARLLAYMLADPSISMSYILDTWVTPEEFDRMMVFVLGAASRHPDVYTLHQIFSSTASEEEAPQPEVVDPPAAKAPRKRSTKPAPAVVVDGPADPPVAATPVVVPASGVQEQVSKAPSGEEDDISAMFRAYAEEPPKEIPPDDEPSSTSEEGVGDMTPDNIEDLFAQ